MPVNSKNMLAPLPLKMQQMSELLTAEQPELELLIFHAKQILLECSANSCEEAIVRYEKIFKQAAGGKTLEERRAAILFLMNARVLVTKEYLELLLSSVLFCQCKIEEYSGEYRFTVNIEGENRSPNMAEAARWVKLLRPAHLEVNLSYRQRQRGTVLAAMRAGIGAHIKVLPYQPRNITVKGDIKLGMFLRGAQCMQVYPKGDIKNA